MGEDLSVPILDVGLKDCLDVAVLCSTCETCKLLPFLHFYESRGSQSTLSFFENVVLVAYHRVLLIDDLEPLLVKIISANDSQLKAVLLHRGRDQLPRVFDEVNRPELGPRVSVLCVGLPLADLVELRQVVASYQAA